MSWSGIVGNLGRISMVALALVAVVCGHAWAESPTETLQGVFAAVNRVLGDPELQQKPQELMGAIHTVMNGSFDFREAARLAMGREWEVRTPTEQDEFVQLFAALLQRAYMSQMVSSQSGMQGGLAIQYTGESVDGDRATVAAVMGSRKRDAARVSDDSGWRALGGVRRRGRRDEPRGELSCPVQQGHQAVVLRRPRRSIEEHSRKLTWAGPSSSDTSESSSPSRYSRWAPCPRTSTGSCRTDRRASAGPASSRPPAGVPGLESSCTEGAWGPGLRRSSGATVSPSS